MNTPKTKPKKSAAEKATNKALGILSDKHGEYRVKDRWVDTWDGSYAGYAVVEVREYWPQDNSGPMVTRVVRGNVVYLHDLLASNKPYLYLQWRLYRDASAALGVNPR